MTFLLAAAFSPFDFDFDVPRYRQDGLLRLADSTLRFTGPSVTRTPAPPVWLPAAIEDAALAVRLEARPARPAQQGPARIFTLSLNQWARNITIAQRGSDLEVRLRRRGSDVNGFPSYIVPALFADGGWHRVDIEIGAGAITVTTDGVRRIAAALPSEALSGWDRQYRLALGDELNGGRVWLGDLRRAQVEVRGERYDYLDPALVEPAVARWYIPERMQGALSPRSLGGWAGIAEHVAGFLAFGAVLAAAGGWPVQRSRILLATLALSLAMEGGQLFFEGRHASLFDIPFNLLGALLGASIVLVVRRRLRQNDEAPSAAAG